MRNNLLLQPGYPIAGTALGVRDREDLDIVQAFAENDGIWETIEKCAARVVEIRSTSQRSFAQAHKRRFEFLCKIQSHHWASVPIPINCIPSFRLG